jgi:hypothetical protein
MYKHNDSCLLKVGDDEPIFVLRAKDKFAPLIVKYWALLARLNGASISKWDEAFNCALVMENWQRKNGCKIPD